MNPPTPSIAQLAEGVGLLQGLTPSRVDDAINFLREISKPGMRFVDGKLVYSAAFLSEPTEGQEVLPI